MRSDEPLDGFDECVGRGHRLLRGGKPISQVTATEGGDAALAGELGDIG